MTGIPLRGYLLHNLRRAGFVAFLVLSLLLSACTAPTQPYNPPPANSPLAHLQTCELAHLHQAAYNYARYHTLALRQVYPERSRRTQDRPPDDLLGRSAELTTKPQAPGRSVHRAGAGRDGRRELPPGGRTGDKGTRKQGDSQALKAFPVLGTRPEPIKPAPVIRELRRHPDRGVSGCVPLANRLEEWAGGGPRSRGDKCSGRTDALISLGRTSEL